MKDYQTNNEIKNKFIISILVGVIFALIGYTQSPYSYVCDDNPHKRDYLACVSNAKEGVATFKEDELLKMCQCDNIIKRKDGVLSRMFLGALLGPTIYAVFLTLKDG